MTYNEQLRQEGRQEGVLAVAKKMLAEGSEFPYIKRMIGLSDEDRKKLAPQYSTL